MSVCNVRVHGCECWNGQRREKRITMGKTAIEYGDVSWNLVTGCTPVSGGCANCWARELHNLRHKAYLAGKKMPVQYARPFEHIQIMEDRLDQPLRWKKPHVVLVNFTGDLFHEDVPEKFLDKVFVRMNVSRTHIFIILTKRPERMLKYMTRYTNGGWGTHEIINHETVMKFTSTRKFVWPLPNVWMGVSVEDQSTANERIPLLLQTPAAHRWVSFEPALGSIDIQRSTWFANQSEMRNQLPPNGVGLDWVVMGGESGKNARPMDPHWARFMRDQCEATGIPFYFKQWGGWVEVEKRIDDGKTYIAISTVMERVGKKAAGRLLDGREWNETPWGET